MDNVTKNIYKPLVKGMKYHVCQYCQRLIPDEDHDNGCVYYSVILEDVGNGHVEHYVNR